MKQSALLVVVLAVLTTPIAADERNPDAPLIWPTVRYGGPERLSAGVTLQPQFAGILKQLVVSGLAGKGGAKAAVGIGAFGGSLMGGYALQATIVRTSDRPIGAPANQTYIGFDAALMIFNFGFRLGPAFQVSERHKPEANKFRLNWSVGFGF
ncbi:MAG TPA: hypothetical protein VJP86_05520 [Vicinamibacterales bacterium]|jgi:hypothetical protein|nr:hypothetical protein [Vicinamibacterales bacterium]